MHSLSNDNKHHDEPMGHSYATSYGGHLSIWFPTKQPQLSLPCGVSNKLESKAEYNCYVKNLSDSGYREKDLCNPCQLHSLILKQTLPYDSFLQTCKTKADLPCGGMDYIGHQVHMEHHNQSLDHVSHPFGESYFGKLKSVYDPNPVVYPQVMGVAPTRAVLPLDCTESVVPIYVNAKQYHAILRRRRTRARLQAPNKMMKSRKPYLHESRHLHALKRVRGSGGCFLNTKNEQKPKPQVEPQPQQHSDNNS